MTGVNDLSQATHLKKKGRSNIAFAASGGVWVRRFRTRERGAVRTARMAAESVFNMHIESKSGVLTYGDGTELNHNRIVLFSSSILSTSQGTADDENTLSKRIGDNISLRSITIKGMLEFNERYSDVSIKVMVIESAKGDTPNDGSIWQGASANKLLDTFNTEWFPIMKSKFIKMRAANMGNTPSGVQTVGCEFQTSTATVSIATKMFKIVLPGKRFGRKGKLQYENNSHSLSITI